MTSPPPDPACGEIADDLAALAVGAVSGHERAQVLDHLEECPHCVGELDRLTATADLLGGLAPDLEPPPGFAERTLERMRADPPIPVTGPRHRWRRMPAGTRRIVVSVAAAVILLAGAAVGELVATAPTPPGGTSVSATAALGHFHSSVGATGTVTAVERAIGHGTTTWLAVTVDVPSGPPSVRCDMTLADGTTHLVGSYPLRRGYASWIVPVGVSAASIRTVRLVGPAGSVVAAAGLA